MPYYSFVLLAYNKWELTKQAITTLVESLDDYHKDKGIELIIVNNGSVDETKDGIEQMKEYYHEQLEIVPVHLSENMGYPVGVNLGLEHYRGEILTIISNDLVFPQNWFDGIVNTLSNNPLIGVAAPFLSYGSGPEHLGVSFPSLKEMREFAKKFMEDNKDKLIYNERIIGACISFKRDVLKLIGGNDFWFGVGLFDDDDWSLRAGIAGYKAVITGSSFVHHIGTVTFHEHADLTSSAFLANYPKFVRKWGRNGFDSADRKGIIKHTKYSKEKHYFPLKIEDFNEPISKIELNPNLKNRKMILIADWKNQHSQWRKKLLDIKSQLSPDSNLFLWIPQLYFPDKEIMSEVEKLLDNDTSYLNFLFDDIDPINLLEFISHYDSFLEVQGDYVNRYLKRLVSDLPIVII